LEHLCLLLFSWKVLELTFFVLCNFKDFRINRFVFSLFQKSSDYIC